MANIHSTSLLLWSESSGNVPIMLSGGEQTLVVAAAHACQAVDNANDFKNQLADLLKVFQDWLEGRRDKIKSAYLAVRERDLLFLVVQKSARFDPDIVDPLTDLDLTIANRSEFGLIDLEVMAVPPISSEALKALLSSGTVVYDAK